MKFFYVLFIFFCFNVDCSIDPDFYLEPRIFLDGHLWRVIVAQHHPECDCLQDDDLFLEYEIEDLDDFTSSE